MQLLSRQRLVEVKHSVQRGQYIVQLKMGQRVLGQVTEKKTGGPEIALEVGNFLAALINAANMNVDQMLAIRAELLSGRVVEFGQRYVSLALLQQGLTKTPQVEVIVDGSAD